MATRTRLLLLAVLAFVNAALSAAEVRVPAFTAYIVPDPEGARVSERRGVTRWTDPALKVCWYGQFPRTGPVTAAVDLRLPAEAESKLRLTVAGQSREVTVRGAGQETLVTAAFGAFDIPSAGYQCWSLESLNEQGKPFGDLDALRLSGPGIEEAHFNLKERRNAASVHLAYPVPRETRVAAFYCEVTAVEDPTATFYMACGWHRGYFGMQVNSPTERRIIFSVWDSGDEAVDRKKVADENRVQLVGKGEGVTSGDFGNEGTGGHSHLKYAWKTGETQRFLVTAQPVDGTKTIFSGYYFHPDRKEWFLISSWKAPKEGGWLRGLHSFSENFWGSNGHLVRKALFGRQWIRTDAGEWIELTTASFSHDPTGRNDRRDRFMGVESGQFFLSHGGFVDGFTPFGERFTRSATGQGPADVPLPAPAPKPNIVFILADDLGWTDTAVYGSQYYETPNIDRLAAEGLRFTHYHSSPNCQPTRAALMTGQYAPRTGVYTVGSIDRFNWRSRPLRPADNVEQLPLGKTTIAQALKASGYATGLFGKWHLGQQGPHHPAQRGFNEAIVSMGAHFEFKTQPPADIPPGAYLADWLTDRAVDFIRRHRDEPFFLYLPHFAVHSPHHAKPELIEKFKDKPGVGGHRNPTYAAMISSLDQSVGRVMRTLEEEGLAGRTVLVFSSDNGGVGGYVREGLRQTGDVTDNAPLRSGKGSLYEGGTRVPLIVRWPGVTPPQAMCEAPTIHVDLFPTFLEIAGAKPPAGQPLDGASLVPLLRDPQRKPSSAAIYQHFPGYLGAGAGAWRTTPVGTITAGDWKLLEFFEDGRLELYQLRDDPGETRNLALEQPEKTRQLQANLRAWREKVNAPMPTRRTAEP
ncbi:MAG TPA: sulfatase-like hydrolase/transferase [Verrucomicrobiota bacterium]|nr:sulfatase-like hydrolase/transferase [Verrucomicrobiota bacterium]HNU50577.1 sulfatase-like hydrolase/transferase [Verrucomicrobiota bacterium]